MPTWFCDDLTKGSTLQTLPNLGNSYFPEGQTPLGIEFTYGQLYAYI